MMQCSPLLEAPNVAAVTARLHAGDVFTALVAERVEDRAAALEQVLREAVTDATRIVWVGNPLRSPLTIERFLLQIAGPEVDLRIDRSPAELAALLGRPAGHETRLLVVVQQPETINPETTETLAAMAAHLDRQFLQVQFLFAGSPSLRLPNSIAKARAECAPPGKQAPLELRPDPQSTHVPSHMPTHLASGRRRDMLPVVALLSIAGLGVMLSCWPTIQVSRGQPAPVRLSLEALSTPVSDTLLSGMSRMREEFDRLLADRATTLPPLTEVQKDALFQEFVTRYRGG